MQILKTFLLVAWLLGCAGGTSPDPAGSPPPGSPGLVQGSLEAAGFDLGMMQRLTAALDRGVYPNTHVVLVAHDGRLVYEKYLAGEDESWGQPIGYREFEVDSRHDLRSVSKSVTALLLGVALGEDFAAALSRPILDYFPELVDQVPAEVAAITLRHVLIMSTGQQWNEMEVPYSNPENDEISMYSSGDPVAYTLGKAVREPPGTSWYYNGGTTMVLAALVERLGGKPFLEFAREALFEPLGIEDRNVEWRGLGIFWKRSKTLPSAASGLRLRARDLLRIGSMVLQGGQWQGRQIVPRGWIEASLQRQIEQDTRWNIDGIYGYSYQWWHAEFDRDWGRFTAICGLGYGGQRLCVVPAKNLVVTIYAGNYGLGNHGVSERILAAIVAAAP